MKNISSTFSDLNIEDYWGLNNLVPIKKNRKKKYISYYEDEEGSGEWGYWDIGCGDPDHGCQSFVVMIENGQVNEGLGI